MAQPSIVLTGFNAFGGFAQNASQRVVELISSMGEYDGRLITKVLPTEFRAAELRIHALLLRHRPGVCICTGLNAAADAVTLETRAVNRDAAEIADNAGERRQGTPIDPDGPPFYESTLPIDRIKRLLEDHQIPVRLSDSAGTFVCNHVFYAAAQGAAIWSPRTRVGFIHLPQAADFTPRNDGIALSDLTKALELYIQACEAEVVRLSTGNDL